MEIYWLWLLSLTGLSNKKRFALLTRFKTPQQIYNSTRSEIEEVRGIKSKDVDYICDGKDLNQATKALAFMEKQHIHLITMQSQYYPERLKNIFNPPVAFFAKGNVELLLRPISIAIVGSRIASPDGKIQAQRMGARLSECGITVISGLADGIDASGHLGALEHIGSTIAVVGTGINICYPQKNKELFRKIVRKGLVISEFFFDEKPLPFHFPLRNRIISGLSDGILVVEAAQKGGALITAKCALEQGKNVYAIPKEISLTQSVGVNNLIKDGAKLVTDIKDILEDYVELLPDHVDEIKDVESGQVPQDLKERKVYQYIKSGYDTPDKLSMICEIDIREINALLSMLELDEWIKIHYGTIHPLK